MTQEERDLLADLLAKDKKEKEAEARKKRDAFAKACKERWGLKPGEIDKLVEQANRSRLNREAMGIQGV